VPVPKKHYFVINQTGMSADRRGPFESAEAAREWADKNYHYPAWIVPAEPVGAAAHHRPLSAKGEPVTED
jgi:hypothetical protein